MDFTTLAIFRAVAEEASVTRAAQRLQRVQSNVTTRIRQLEDELGVALFSRDGKRMLLTEQGRAYLAYAERLLALEEEARQAVRPGRPEGSLRLGSMESTAASRLPAVLADYHQAWPAVALAVTTGPTRTLLDALVAHRLDAALVARALVWQDGGWVETPLEPTLEGEPVFTEDLLLVTPEAHPPVNGPQDVTTPRIAGFATGCAYRDLLASWLASAGRRLPVQEVGSYHAILACVAAGACVAVMPRSVLDLLREPPRLRVTPLVSVDTLLVRRRGYASAAFDALRDGLLAAPTRSPR